MANSSLKLTNRLFFFLWRKKYRDFVLFSLLFLILLGTQYFFPGPVVTPDNLTTDALTDHDLTVQVARVVDGDTFVYLTGGEEVKVRLLGIDTPETVDPRKEVQCFGKEASAMTNNLIGGKTVKLVADTKGDSRDKYGRELRYIYLPDGTMVNRLLVENGFAHATPEYSFSYKEEFVNLENQAKIQEKGLWSPTACN